MPSAATINLTNVAAVVSALAPRRIGPDEALLVGQDSVTSAGAKTLSVSLSSASSSRKTDHVNIKLQVPTEHVVDGITKVANVAIFTGKFVLPETLTAAQRADFKAYVDSVISDTIISGYVTDLEPMFG
jgi:hypothetical protein